MSELDKAYRLISQMMKWMREDQIEKAKLRHALISLLYMEGDRWKVGVQGDTDVTNIVGKLLLPALAASDK